jgi:hypothetical protein
MKKGSNWMGYTAWRMWKNTSATVSVNMFFCYRGYDRPLLHNGCYRTVLIWEVTMACKVQYAGAWGGEMLSDQTTKGGGNSIGTMQLGGPGFMSWSFREQIKYFHNLLRQKSSFLFMLKGWSTTSIASLTLQSMYLALVLRMKASWNKIR